MPDDGDGVESAQIDTSGMRQTDMWWLRELIAQGRAADQRYAEQRLADTERHFNLLRTEQHRFDEERDRRYKEVGVEREKATVVALNAANDKAERHNDLISANERATAQMATKTDLESAMREIHATMIPLSEFMTATLAARQTIDTAKQSGQVSMGMMIAAMGAVVGIAAIIVTVILANLG